MSFLLKSELKTKSLTEVVDIITRYDDETVTEIIDQEIDVFKGYLKRFDTEVIFSAEGSERSKTVLKHLKACVVFEIFCIRSHQYNEVVKLAHDEAMNWLEKVSTGKIDTNLPLPEADEGNGNAVDGFYKLGSRKSYQNGW